MSGRADRYRASATEAQLIKAVKDFVTAEGGLCWHVRDSRSQDVASMPDLICVLPQRAYAPAVVGFIEVKTQKDVLRDDQRRALFLLDRATETVATVLRPVPKDSIVEAGLDDVLAMLGKRDD